MEKIYEHESPEERLIRLFELDGTDDNMVVAQVGLVIDMQFAVQAAMKERGITQKKLAEIMDCSASNISQMLADDANPQIETIARALSAMGEKFIFASESIHGKWITSDFEQKMDQINERVTKCRSVRETMKDFKNFDIVPVGIPKKVKLEKNRIRKANDNSWLQGARVKALSEQISEQLQAA